MNVNKTTALHAPMAQGRRRWMLAAGAYLILAAPVIAQAHNVGIVKPKIAIPGDLPVVRSDGARLSLRELLRGRRTLLQLMFTGCGETCPLQGALFAAVRGRFAAAVDGKNQLLSLSIDPMDDPATLSTWLRQFGAGQGWIAAVPSARGIEVMRTSLQSGADTASAHPSQVFFIDESEQLIWRTEDFPSTEIVIGIGKRNRWIS